MQKVVSWIIKNKREKEGVFYKKCGCSDHYWLQNKWQWECKSCQFRTTLRSRTLIESSKLPFRKRHLAIDFISSGKKGISVKELQLRNYKTI